MRVCPNNDGSEVIFTLYQRPDMADQMFAEDAKAVKRDLERLKTLLELFEPEVCIGRLSNRLNDDYQGSHVLCRFFLGTRGMLESPL
jgi:hypothetical protein